eukprot:g5112.t1
MARRLRKWWATPGTPRRLPIVFVTTPPPGRRGPSLVINERTCSLLVLAEKYGCQAVTRSISAVQTIGPNGLNRINDMTRALRQCAASTH